ncbi:hypothetical protein SFR_6905 (plasmid) [Streptomyces sp. FR-008]|nr:hypothetical protein SFR_6905 [Streptomyces sp. FR-008]
MVVGVGLSAGGCPGRRPGVPGFGQGHHVVDVQAAGPLDGDLVVVREPGAPGNGAPGPDLGRDGGLGDEDFLAGVAAVRGVVAGGPVLERAPGVSGPRLVGGLQGSHGSLDRQHRRGNFLCLGSLGGGNGQGEKAGHHDGGGCPHQGDLHADANDLAASNVTPGRPSIVAGRRRAMTFASGPGPAFHAAAAARRHARAVASDVRRQADRLPTGTGPRALAELVLQETDRCLTTPLRGTARCAQNRARAVCERLDRLKAALALERTSGVAPTVGRTVGCTCGS